MVFMVMKKVVNLLIITIHVQFLADAAYLLNVFEVPTIDLKMSYKKKSHIITSILNYYWLLKAITITIMGFIHPDDQNSERNFVDKLFS